VSCGVFYEFQEPGLARDQLIKGGTQQSSMTKWPSGIGFSPFCLLAFVFPLGFSRMQMQNAGAESEIMR